MEVGCALAIREIGFDARFVGHANDKVVEIVKRSDRRFGGLIGLPFLRMLEYVGDQGFFWVRTSESPRERRRPAMPLRRARGVPRLANRPVAEISLTGFSGR